MNTNPKDTPKANKDAVTRHLQELVNADPDSLQANVATIILNLSAEDPHAFLSDIVQDGTLNGLYNNLRYHTDTDAFFDSFYDDIEVLRVEVERVTGEPLIIQGELKDFFTWFGFKAAAQIILREFDR